MEAKDVISKVRRIEIKARGLSKQVFAGQYLSAFKGKGMAFSEVREYQYGDDVRSVDWNVTARFNHPFIKVFEEERELTVMLLIDVSQSNFFGSSLSYKSDVILELAGVLSFSAIFNNDKVGVILFSDIIEKYIPPKKGKSHILRIISELIRFQPQNRKTDIKMPLKFLTNVIKKKCTAFLISDFQSDSYEEALRICKKRHDLVAIRLMDKLEKELPNVGLIRAFDIEKQEIGWIDTASEKVRIKYQEYWENFNNKTSDLFKKTGTDEMLLLNGEDYVKPLIKLFKKREAKY
ncbi:MAG: DUF58 domain-containing protein [Bacteroidales bacterium]|nr:DUF58 domain-containing protein [Bacteroidales bacterium]MDD4576526.1 DUF58 domain-containing protein [Bacteroidales bacterium]